MANRTSHAVLTGGAIIPDRGELIAGRAFFHVRIVIVAMPAAVANLDMEAILDMIAVSFIVGFQLAAKELTFHATAVMTRLAAADMLLGTVIGLMNIIGIVLAMLTAPCVHFHTVDVHANHVEFGAFHARRHFFAARVTVVITVCIGMQLGRARHTAAPAALHMITVILPVGAQPQLMRIIADLKTALHAVFPMLILIILNAATHMVPAAIAGFTANGTPLAVFGIIGGNIAAVFRLANGAIAHAAALHMLACIVSVFIANDIVPAAGRARFHVRIMITAMPAVVANLDMEAIFAVIAVLCIVGFQLAAKEFTFHATAIVTHFATADMLLGAVIGRMNRIRIIFAMLAAPCMHFYAIDGHADRMECGTLHTKRHTIIADIALAISVCITMQFGLTALIATIPAAHHMATFVLFTGSQFHFMRFVQGQVTDFAVPPMPVLIPLELVELMTLTVYHGATHGAKIAMFKSVAAKAELTGHRIAHRFLALSADQDMGAVRARFIALTPGLVTCHAVFHGIGHRLAAHRADARMRAIAEVAHFLARRAGHKRILHSSSANSAADAVPPVIIRTDHITLRMGFALISENAALTLLTDQHMPIIITSVARFAAMRNQFAVERALLAVQRMTIIAEAGIAAILRLMETVQVIIHTTGTGPSMILLAIDVQLAILHLRILSAVGALKHGLEGIVALVALAVAVIIIAILPASIIQGHFADGAAGRMSAVAGGLDGTGRIVRSTRTVNDAIHALIADMEMFIVSAAVANGRNIMRDRLSEDITIRALVGMACITEGITFIESRIMGIAVELAVRAAIDVNRFTVDDLLAPSQVLQLRTALAGVGGRIGLLRSVRRLVGLLGSVRRIVGLLGSVRGIIRRFHIRRRSHIFRMGMTHMEILRLVMEAAGAGRDQHHQRAQQSKNPLLHS